MRFSPSFLDEIRDRIPIADIVGRRVTFDRKKSNQSKGDFWACCPFHGEKSPSFHCENQKGPKFHSFSNSARYYGHSRCNKNNIPIYPEYDFHEIEWPLASTSVHIVQIAAGDCHSIALGLDGSIYTWGSYKDKDSKPFYNT